MRADLLLTNDLVLRPLSATDGPVFADLLARCGQSGNHHPDFLQLLQSATMPFLLLETNAGQELVGYLDWTEPNQPFVQIAPEYRLRGFASQALDRASRCREDLGEMSIQLDQDDLPARLLLEKCSFKRVPESPESQPRYTAISEKQRLRAWDMLDARYRQSRQDLVMLIHHNLGIADDYAHLHQLELALKATELSSIGNDIYGRCQYLTPDAATAWQELQQAAAEAGESLQAVSAYRGVRYQESIIRRKLDSGSDIDEILKISAAPGFSEHHSGHAIDITTPGSATLEEEFEHTTAFTWLTNNANRFGYYLSYPRNNKHQIAYEPWHWAFVDSLNHPS